MTNAPTEQHWEQPSFDTRPAGEPVSGPVLVPAATLVVAPPTPQEETLRTMRRLVWPLALVVAVVTGSWVSALVLAIVASAVLKRQLFLAWQQRVQLERAPAGTVLR